MVTFAHIKPPVSGGHCPRSPDPLSRPPLVEDLVLWPLPEARPGPNWRWALRPYAPRGSSWTQLEASPQTLCTPRLVLDPTGDEPSGSMHPEARRPRPNWRWAIRPYAPRGSSWTQLEASPRALCTHSQKQKSARMVWFILYVFCGAFIVCILTSKCYRELCASQGKFTCNFHNFLQLSVLRHINPNDRPTNRQQHVNLWYFNCLSIYHMTDSRGAGLISQPRSLRPRNWSISHPQRNS